MWQVMYHAYITRACCTYILHPFIYSCTACKQYIEKQRWPHAAKRGHVPAPPTKCQVGRCVYTTDTSHDTDKLLWRTHTITSESCPCTFSECYLLLIPFPFDDTTVQPSSSLSASTLPLSSFPFWSGSCKFKTSICSFTLLSSG